MGLNITVIDDGVMAALQSLESTVDGTGALSSPMIKLLLEKGEQSFIDDSEAELFKLFKDLTESVDEQGNAIWNSVTSFTHPEFYLKAFEQQLYRSDLIIFDWTYRSRPLNHIDTLAEILDASHAYLFVFTADDNIDEVQEVLHDQRLIPFGQRMGVYKKGEDTDALISKAKELQEVSFSFKFGDMLRKVTNKSLDRILNKLAALNIERVLSLLARPNAPQLDFDFKQMLGERIKANLRESSQIKEFLLQNQEGINEQVIEELIELISERLKGDIAAEDLPHLPLATATTATEESSTVKELWSYRLYHVPHGSDLYVRKGDILVSTNDNGDRDWSKLFFVLSPDCDLSHFWKKNLGYLLLAPAYLISSDNTILKDRQELTRNINAGFRQAIRVSSLSNTINNLGGNPLVLPFIKSENSLYAEYILFPKEISSTYVEMPVSWMTQQTGERDKPLQYNYLPNFQRVCTLNEPFLTPTAQHILSSISGYGVPDYPTEASSMLAETLKLAFP